MPNLESFLTLEFSLQRRLRAAFTDTMTEVGKEIGGAADAGRFDIAHDLVNTRLSFEPMLAQVGNVFEITAVSAFLLGAAVFRDGDIKATNVMRGAVLPEPVEVGSETLGNQFKDQFSLHQTHQERVHRLINRMEKQTLEAQERAVDNDESDFETIFGISITGASLNAAVQGGKALTDIGANLTTSRLVSYGFLSEANSAGVRQYQRTAVMDRRTCPICVGLHGRIFSVPPALAKIQTQLMASADPDALKGIGFPKQTTENLKRMNGMSNGDLSDKGFDFPPSHPLCRCTMVRIGTVKKPQMSFPASAAAGAAIGVAIGSGAGAETTDVSSPELGASAEELAAEQGISHEAAVAMLEEEEDERRMRDDEKAVEETPVEVTPDEPEPLSQLEERAEELAAERGITVEDATLILEEEEKRSIRSGILGLAAVDSKD